MLNLLGFADILASSKGPLDPPPLQEDADDCIERLL
jgi:hypothetical protein